MQLLEDLLLHHEPVTSEFINGELGRKLVKNFRFPECEANQLAALLRRVGMVIEPADLLGDPWRAFANVGYRVTSLELIKRY